MAVGRGAGIAGAVHSAWERGSLRATGDCGAVSEARVERGYDDWGRVFAGACIDCHTVGEERVEGRRYE